MNYRYSLDNSAKKFICPACKKRRFVRYKDKETGKYLSEDIGRCDREDNCGYHYTPGEYFKEQGDIKNYDIKDPIRKSKKRNIMQYCIPETSVDDTTSMGYKKNHFILFLRSLFSSNIVKELIAQYFIGSSDYWEGATVFWQIDVNGKFRTGKIMLYNSFTGKRIKKPNNYINWMHAVLKKKGEISADFCLKQCLFGEHQLVDAPKGKTIAIVESEKTAIIMSAIFPDYIWMASGGKNGVNWNELEVWKNLKGRKLILYPDLNAYDEWEEKSRQLRNMGIKIAVSDLLERKASKGDRNRGLDIADYFIAQLKQKSLQKVRNTLSKEDRIYVTLRSDASLIDQKLM